MRSTRTLSAKVPARRHAEPSPKGLDFTITVAYCDGASQEACPNTAATRHPMLSCAAAEQSASQGSGVQ